MMKMMMMMLTDDSSLNLYEGGAAGDVTDTGLYLLSILNP